MILHLLLFCIDFFYLQHTDRIIFAARTHGFRDTGLVHICRIYGNDHTDTHVVSVVHHLFFDIPSPFLAHQGKDLSLLEGSDRLFSFLLCYPISCLPNIFFYSSPEISLSMVISRHIPLLLTYAEYFHRNESGYFPSFPVNTGEPPAHPPGYFPYIKRYGILACVFYGRTGRPVFTVLPLLGIFQCFLTKHNTEFFSEP